MSTTDEIFLSVVIFAFCLFGVVLAAVTWMETTVGKRGYVKAKGQYHVPERPK